MLVSVSGRPDVSRGRVPTRSFETTRPAGRYRSRCVHLRRDASPARGAEPMGLGVRALRGVRARRSPPAAARRLPSSLSSSVPERLIGSSYATLRVQLSDTGFVYFLATPQDDAGALADATDDGPHVVIANVTTDERRAVPTPEEVRLGVLAFLNDTDSDPSNDYDNASYAFGARRATGTLNVTAADAVFRERHRLEPAVAQRPLGRRRERLRVGRRAADARRAARLPRAQTAPGIPRRHRARTALATSRRPRCTSARPPRASPRRLDEPGNVYLAVQSASARALTSAQVRAKAAANESGTCSKLVPAANVEHVVPVGCPVFNLSQATSYAAYFVVEGLGLTFVTHGEPPSPPRPSRGSSSPRTTPRRAAPPRLALLRATASRSPRRARKTAWRISSSSRRVTPRPRSRTSCEAWARAALSPRLWDRSS